MVLLLFPRSGRFLADSLHVTLHYYIMI